MTTLSNVAYRRKLLFPVLILGGVLLTLEIGAFLLHWLIIGRIFSYSQMSEHRGRLMWQQRNSLDLPAGSEAIRDTDGSPVVVVLHPYAGFVRDPQRSAIGPIGFPGESGPIAAKPENEVLVGIFGGSFAAGFCGEGGNRLFSEIGRIPRYRGRPVRAVCMAEAGYKQPQQLQVLTYLLALGQRFDLVICVDGFNEVALPSADLLPKKINPYYPSNWYGITQGLNGRAMQIYAEVLVLRQQQFRLAAFMENGIFRFSVAANVLWKAVNRWLDAREAALEEGFARNNEDSRQTAPGYQTSGPPYEVSSEDSLFLDLTRLWQRSSLQMHHLCTSNGIPFFHFLQPNQYVENSKVFSAEERKRAFNKSHPYRPGVVGGYPLLRRAGYELVAQGVSFGDLTMVLRRVSADLYNDDCCHLNARGLTVVGQIIGRCVAELVQGRETGSAGAKILDINRVADEVVAESGLETSR